MSDELLSLRALIVSPEAALREMFRQAAGTLSVPCEMVEAADADGACRAYADGADLAYLDGALPPAEMIRITATMRAGRQSVFSVQLALGTAASSLVADGMAGKPSRVQEAKWLLERSMRVRLPSRVLVVDDSSTMRSIVRKTLAAARFPLEVSEAAEGQAALKLVREGNFDIVFLDYNMPDFDGLEILSEFKREQRDLKVVMMTSAPRDELVERARALGAAFLKKPFFPADIEAALSSYYGLRAVNPLRA